MKYLKGGKRHGMVVFSLYDGFMDLWIYGFMDFFLLRLMLIGRQPVFAFFKVVSA